MAADIPHFTLNDGTRIPSVGMGCWMGIPGGGESAEIMCKKAIKYGYRHFDTAFGYFNEEHVGKAIRESGIPRSEFYITTKLTNSDHHRVREGFETSLKNLDCDYIDLYLMHWPQATTEKGPIRPDESPTIIDTWRNMEKLLETGKVKTIGVSNFSIKTLEQLRLHWSVVPAVNQVEMHPCLPCEDLKAYCDEKGILLVAYSPLGRPLPGQSQTVFATEPTITRIAEKLEVTWAQVVLSWGVQRGTSVIPKSENDDRMKANLRLIKLSVDDMSALNNIHKSPGMHKSLLAYHRPDGTVLGWTYEELGWNLKPGGIVG
ncbi:Aldo/keto reductase [Punctularia strigosozonata HHB-11173 SS5]|uniref:Aldo/keto reductase n=1 Tax=Punctularia strigosozonata (strain HHB-11173) TaxID=741275 RepID=R7S242_PUNST|nr:Aldo/keto reductase [Punctularia strigosozonata HHB-11173 SS5]EIN03934.1 Aldo/keto reductase [Punctularia strigosozonata HHB-11173 SS5]